LPVEPLPLKERIIKDPVKELQSEYPDKLIFPVDENDIL
jgi:hypothetical protein